MASYVFNPFMPEVEIFELMHEIHEHDLQILKEQEFEEEKKCFNNGT